MQLSLTIDQFNQNQVILKTEDNEIIIWPRHKLPENIREGSVLIFFIIESQNLEQEKQQRAKDILNEILNVEE